MWDLGHRQDCLCYWKATAQSKATAPAGGQRCEKQEQLKNRPAKSRRDADGAQDKPVLHSYSNPWLSFLCALKPSVLRSFVIQSRASIRGR